MPLNTGESGATGSTDGSIGGYTLVERLGSGGMGVVYLARSASGRQVAVKVVHAQHALDEEFRARFRQEIAAVRRVSGAFTAPVVDADPDADQPWMATLYVPGPTLAEAVDRQGPLGGRELRTLALGLVEALRDIHQAGVVHRDLKPSNVLIAEDGPRVIDFGISRASDNQALTVTGRLIGTPPFMSPEQFASPKDVTPASDVFSLGSLLVYAATGARPFDGASPYMTGYQVMHEAPTLDGVPEPLRAIATRCLDKDPTARPTPTELHALLQTLPDVSPPVAPEAATPPEPTTTTTTSPPPARRRRTLIALATALAVTTLAITHMLSSHTAASGTPTASTSSTSGSRTAVLPARWRPWQRSLTRTFNGAPPLYASQSGCVAGTGTAVYCAGRGFTVTKLDAATGRVLWRYGTNPQQVLPAGVRDGLVYVYEMPAGALYADKQPVQLVALDANTGKQRWSRPNGQYLDQAYLFSRGILTTSTNQTQYVAYGTSGEQLWRTSASAPAGRSCSPLVLGTAPYVLCTPDDNAGTVSVTLFSLAASDGTRRALATLPPLSESLGTVGGQLLFAVPVAQDKSEALDTTYQALLRVNPNTGAMERIPLTGNPTGTSTPALVDGVVYFVRQDGTVTAVTASHGKRLWQRATEIEDLSAPTVSKSYGTVYLANRFGRLLALNSTTGAERWHTSGLKVEGDSTEEAHILLLKDAIMATAMGAAFSVSPDHPTATQSPATTSN